MSLQKYDDKVLGKQVRQVRSQSSLNNNFSTLYCADIQGAQPTKLNKQLIQKSYSSLQNDDIEGTVPKKFYCKTQRNCNSLCTRDIQGANSEV